MHTPRMLILVAALSAFAPAALAAPQGCRIGPAKCTGAQQKIADEKCQDLHASIFYSSDSYQAVSCKWAYWEPGNLYGGYVYFKFECEKTDGKTGKESISDTEVLAYNSYDECPGSEVSSASSTILPAPVTETSAVNEKAD